MATTTPSPPSVVVQPCWVDSSGNIKVNGRSALTLVLTFQDVNQNPIDVSAVALRFEVEDTLETVLSPVAGQPSQQQLFLDQDLVALVGVSPNPKFGPPFVLRDVTAGLEDAVVLWEGMMIVRGYTDEPPNIWPTPPIQPPTPQPPTPPSWLPITPSGRRPLAYADVVNGNYWNGQLCAMSDVLVSPPTSFGALFTSASIFSGQGIGWDATVYPQDGSPFLAGGLLDPTVGCTVVTTVNAVDPGQAGYGAAQVSVQNELNTVSAGGVLQVALDGSTSGMGSNARFGPDNDTVYANGQTPTTLGKHVMAVTMAMGTGLDWVIDGVAQPSLSTGNPPAAPVTQLYWQFTSLTDAYTAHAPFLFGTVIAVYEPPLPASDLPLITVP